MLLAVDVGNTQTALGLYAGENLLAHWRLASLADTTADELALRIRSLLALDGQSDQRLASALLGDTIVRNAVVASVVPALTEQWERAAARLARERVLIVDSSLDIGLDLAYADPTEIGADRLADAVAALALYGAPCIVVDFGTATNIEVIDEKGSFIGGVIAPGLVTSAQALFSAAARIAKTKVEVPTRVIGKSTEEALRAGLTLGEIDRIDGLVRRIEAELGYPATVVATGGLSERVVGLSQTISIVNDTLTLEGLRLIHHRV
ncbi:MAG: type III pantothenate kinase [Coriobacteriales bacterium]|jgi:type III pantothenate kinase|nr:type III pantothenate kinase [Coriobacteriales bacterium]